MINENEYNSSYKIVAEAFAWGPASTKAIITLEKEIKLADLCEFNVYETNSYFSDIKRTITNVYLLDENGEETNGSSKHIVIEMSVDPSHGRLFYYDNVRKYNIWDENYKLKFIPKSPQNDILEKLSVNPKYTERITPQTNEFEFSLFKFNDIIMNYAQYTPSQKNGKSPLLVWLHGQAEGGNDITITLLGNEVTELANKSLQKKLDYPYIIVPQCPTYWTETKKNKGKFGVNPSGKSYYTQALKVLIDEVIANNNIDNNRIYIGGCSMGGFMTMNMIMEYPNFFAAAFPICEFYPDRLITEDNIKTLSKIPIWFTYCNKDDTVISSEHSVATIYRIKKLDSIRLHFSEFDDVYDTTGKYFGKHGKPYKYNPHWVWIYAFNDECFDGELNMWEWLAQNKK